MILIGDCREQLRTLEADSVQTCVTSPPYWGLRDYGTATWEGGDEGCGHVVTVAPRATRTAGGLTGGTLSVDAGTVRRGDCPCGARRIDSQLGLEETPEAYVAAMVAVFREVRRVLKSDGTLWLNLGDSYNTAGGVNGGGKSLFPDEARHKGLGRAPGLKPKDLCGIPWRVAFALQAAGWWLRSDIIWAKPNPMPESVTDRPTKAHEYVFLLAKSESYFFDAKAIAEPSARLVETQTPKVTKYTGNGSSGRNDDGRQMGEGFLTGEVRNARSVWPIASEPYDGAHFAVMPSALVARCVLAGSRMGDTVLDPFLGSGTVGIVAEQLGRKWVGCELNPKFAELAEKRTAQQGLFANAG